MPNEKGFADSTAEASVSGSFKDVKRVRGLIIDMNKIPPREFDGESKWEPKEQIQVDLDDAVVLATFSGDEPPDLKDNKFTIYVPYQTAENTARGKTPSANSIYMKCFVASSEELGMAETGEKVRPLSRIGTYVTLERMSVELFKTYKKDDMGNIMIDDEGNKILEPIYSANSDGIPYSGAWCFVGDEGADSTGVKDYLVNLLTYNGGLNKQAALRVLLTDNRAKQFPEYKEALQNGTLAELLGLEIDANGVFKQAEAS